MRSSTEILRHIALRLEERGESAHDLFCAMTMRRWADAIDALTKIGTNAVSLKVGDEVEIVNEGNCPGHPFGPPTIKVNLTGKRGRITNDYETSFGVTGIDFEGSYLIWPECLRRVEPECEKPYSFINADRRSGCGGRTPEHRIRRRFRGGEESEMNLPWSERVNMLSVNPDAATRDDVAKMAAELQESRQNWMMAARYLRVLADDCGQVQHDALVAFARRVEKREEAAAK